MNIKYRVTLTTEKRNQLMRTTFKGKTGGYRIRHANKLLVIEEIKKNKEWNDKSIAKAYHTKEKSIGDLRRRLVEKGLEAALGREKREVAQVETEKNTALLIGIYTKYLTQPTQPRQQCFSKDVSTACLSNLHIKLPLETAKHITTHILIVLINIIAS